MEVFYYFGAILLYAVIIVYVTLKISEKKKYYSMVKNQEYLRCNENDLIDSKHDLSCKCKTSLPKVKRRSGNFKNQSKAPSNKKTTDSTTKSEEVHVTKTDEIDIIEKVITHLIYDSFVSLYSFLQTGTKDEIISNLHYIKEFRNDERFIMVVSEMLSHKFPEVQVEMRKILEEMDDPTIMEELVDLSINQTHNISTRFEETTTDDEIDSMDRDELISNIRRENDPEKLLKYVDAIMKFHDPEVDEVIEYATDKILGRNPRWSSRNRVFIPEEMDSLNNLSFRKKLKLSEVGIGFNLNRSENYVKILNTHYRSSDSFNEDIYDAIKDDNEFIRGRALITLSNSIVNSQTYYILIDRLKDISSYVRSCAIQALDNFLSISRQHNIIDNTKDIRNLLLSHTINEENNDVIRKIEILLPIF